jgi:probable rRNA maturation factor
MLLLSKAFESLNTMGTMSNTPFSYSDHQSFPVEIINEQDHICIDEEEIKYICGRILCDAGFRTGRLGIVFTDNKTIHVLNRKYLKHDCPTDVISFTLECSEDHLEAELIISTEAAKERCEEFGRNAVSELLLYVIHGILHQVGYDDQDEYDVQLMRDKEAYYLRLLGIE